MQWCPLWYLLYLVSVFCGGVHDVGHGDVHGAGRDGETLLPRRQRLQPPFPMPGQAPFQSWESVKMEVWKWKFPKVEIIFILITRFSWQRCCLQCLELGFSYLSFCKTSKYLWYRLHNTRHQTSEEKKGSTLIQRQFINAADELCSLGTNKVLVCWDLWRRNWNVLFVAASGTFDEVKSRRFWERCKK